jgi:hypothetical protein
VDGKSKGKTPQAHREYIKAISALLALEKSWMFEQYGGLKEEHRWVEQNTLE